jgi:hypothetical protein
VSSLSVKSLLFSNKIIDFSKNLKHQKFLIAAFRESRKQKFIREDKEG